MHGNYTAVTAMQQADLLLALGSRFDDRVTGQGLGVRPAGARSSTSTSTRPRSARCDGPRSASSPTAGSPSRRSSRSLRAARPGRSRAASAPWMATLRQVAGGVPVHLRPLRAGPRRGHAGRRSGRRPTLKPQFVIESLRASTPPDTILVSGVGQHQMWASQYWAFEYPNTWINSGGLGTMGFAVPAAIGAKVGRPDRMVWAVDGDGCFQMTAQELATASAERIPVKIAILNNAYLGMVRQWQHMFYEERYSEVYLSPDLPDYVGWAESMGCVGLRVESPEEVMPAIEKANDDRRPPGRDRLPDRLDGAGLPDGAGGRLQRRHRRPPLPAGPRIRGVAMSQERRAERPRHHLLSVLVENKAGVLARVAGLFSRRGYNIFSLAVAPTDDERFSRISIVVDVESAPFEQVVAQLDKLINVVEIGELHPDEAREAELLLVSVSADAGQRSQVIQLVGVFGGRIVDVGHDAITVMVAGTPERARRLREPDDAVRDRRAATDRPDRALLSWTVGRSAAGRARTAARSRLDRAGRGQRTEPAITRSIPERIPTIS